MKSKGHFAIAKNTTNAAVSGSMVGTYSKKFAELT